MDRQPQTPTVFDRFKQLDLFPEVAGLLVGLGLGFTAAALLIPSTPELEHPAAVECIPEVVLARLPECRLVCSS